MEKPKILVEIQLKESFSVKKVDISIFRDQLVNTLIRQKRKIKKNILYSEENIIDDLQEYVLSLVVSENIPENFSSQDIVLYTYTSNNHGPEEEPLNAGSDSSEDVTASNHWILPSTDFVGLWESLIFQDGVKDQILKFVETAMIFSECKINTNLISCNRIVLLHGPPGMGKTSLCRAVAQKISIRFQKKYNFIHLIEINSHSLFSKWFSESGKLVQKLFNQLRDLAECSSSMVCILIDEIESIAFTRGAISNKEPTDSVRAVNAFLTQLDQIRKYTNVLVLATSNLTSSIDVAFLDRADIKQFIGPPSDAAISTIYATMLMELVRVGIIELLGDESTGGLGWFTEIQDDPTYPAHADFITLCQLSRGLSGRTLRKIPMLAHTYIMEEDETCSKVGIDLFKFIKAMSFAVVKHTSDTESLNKH
ncbi:pachytene checkpoint protein 2 homolog [Sergentomyia squamirostris]